MAWKESKDFTKVEKIEGPIELVKPTIPQPINVSEPCKVRNCVAIDCKWNVGRKCSLEEIDIGPDAQCLKWEERV